MRPFAYATPKSLDEAIAILSQNNGQVKPLAGGTDLITQIQDQRKTPATVMDVKSIPELLRLELVPGEGLHIGAAVTCTDIADYAPVKAQYPSIYKASTIIGSVQIQNRASLGGNICNATPSADSAPPLITYGAKAIIAGPAGRREVELEKFFTGPGQTVLGPNELLVELLVPPAPRRSSSSYLRFTPREEMDIAIAGAAALVGLAPRGKRCAIVRIALSAVAPIPLRVRDAEQVLEGAEPTPALLQQAGEKASAACRPITDVRGSADYRRELVKVLTRRSLEASLASLGIS